MLQIGLHWQTSYVGLGRVPRKGYKSISFSINPEKWVCFAPGLLLKLLIYIHLESLHLRVHALRPVIEKNVQIRYGKRAAS